MKARGFTLVEIMIVITILGLISTVAIPNFRRGVEKAQEVGCLKNRRVVEDMEELFLCEQRQHTSSFDDLVDYAYLKKVPSCPAGGTWGWGNYATSSTNYKTLLECSVHGLEVPVGSTAVTIDASKYTQVSSASRWFQDGTDMWTAWRYQWIEYTLDFTEGAGTYKISATAKNHAGDWTIVDGYEYFHVKVYVDGKYEGTMFIPASDDTYNAGDLEVEIPDRGSHKVTLKWMNDAWDPGKNQDTNIKLKDISVSKE